MSTSALHTNWKRNERRGARFNSICDLNYCAWKLHAVSTRLCDDLLCLSVQPSGRKGEKFASFFPWISTRRVFGVLGWCCCCFVELMVNLVTFVTRNTPGFGWQRAFWVSRPVAMVCSHVIAERRASRRVIISPLFFMLLEEPFSTFYRKLSSEFFQICFVQISWI